MLNEHSKGIEIKILTLNIWGIPFVSKNRVERVEAIAFQLSNGNEQYDFVFLQEVWSQNDYKLISEKVSKCLPFSHYFHNGVIGSGLCILSRHPIMEVHFHPWSLNGFPHKLNHGDWWGGKGVGLCRTVVSGYSILLANAHLHAEYNHKCDEYIHHRVIQAFETSQLLRFCCKSDDILIFAGDMNSQPTDVSYRLLRYNSGVIDTFVDSPSKPADVVGATNESPINSYSSLKSLCNNSNGKRIDHIFVKASRQCKVTTKLCDQPWPTRVPLKSFSFSDHEAVRAIILVEDIEGETSQDLTAQTDALLDSAAVCTQGLRKINSSSNYYMIYSTLLAILQLILIGFICAESTNGSIRGVLVFLHLILIPFLIFFVFMAVVWNNSETKSVLSAKCGLECHLMQLQQVNAKLFEEEKKKSSVITNN